MTMTTTEQNTLFQAIKSLEEAVILRTQDGANVYVLCRLVPIRAMNPTDAAAFATAYSVTIASP